MYDDHDSPLMHRDVLISTRQRKEGSIDSRILHGPACYRFSMSMSEIGETAKFGNADGLSRLKCLLPKSACFRLGNGEGNRQREAGEDQLPQ
ncbi:hypothetical protein L596_000497 [Steinernema carpocapsae]|uniref:Uncharacterized protein n=1 Tax=Steinernema carpocapsae TaxID=34508 RepID=A0A4U8UJP7_STECR|nr:hypothetical protein L596_000497 [Steinernema carpocapsae]